jgi:hypothetical protein
MAEVRRVVASDSTTSTTSVANTSTPSTSSASAALGGKKSSRGRNATNVIGGRVPTVAQTKREALVESIFMRYLYISAIVAVVLVALTLLPQTSVPHFIWPQHASSDDSVHHQQQQSATTTTTTTPPTPKKPKAPDIHLTWPNGVPKDGHPTYEERSLTTLINAARASPYHFRMLFFANTTNHSHLHNKVLASNAYMPPLYWNFNLARGANKEALKHEGVILGTNDGKVINHLNHLNDNHLNDNQLNAMMRWVGYGRVFASSIGC